MMDKNQILKIFKSTGALLDGHFVLTSGRHSASYFQCAKVLQYPEYLTTFSALISDQFQDKKPDVVISPAIGGIVLSTEVGVKLGCRTIFAERKNGEMVIRRGFNLDKEENVLIVEDVITTGGSVKEVMDIVYASGANIIGLGTLVDRSNGTIKLHNNQYSIIKMDAVTYHKNNIPKNLAALPAEKPGSKEKV